MDVLPLRTQPPEKPTYRRHAPSHGRYGSYRACLRWDFGFVCAFCLLHESDFTPEGAEGLGIFTAEHVAPQDEDPGLANDYTNLVYACRFCNRARFIAPTHLPGFRLLDPTKDAWADHFHVEGNQLTPVPGDNDAHYTCDTYDLNDHRKVKRRKRRWKDLARRIRLVQDGPRLLDELSGYLQSNVGSVEKSRELFATIRELHQDIREAHAQLEPYAAVPADAPRKCRCGTTEMHSLPEEFARQTVQI